jgi:hypothetical protein
MMAVVLGLASDQTSQLLRTHFQFGERAILTAAVAVESAAQPVPRYHTLPMILTVPFAVTRTQQMIVARLKQRDEITHRVGQIRSNLKAAPGLLAGLALIGASQSSHH